MGELLFILGTKLGTSGVTEVSIGVEKKSSGVSGSGSSLVLGFPRNTSIELAVPRRITLLQSGRN